MHSSRRASRAAKDCRLDREKLGLWRWWLGLEVQLDAELDAERQYLRNDWLHRPEAAVATANAVVGVDPSQWGADEKRPDPDDVWDLIENRVSPRFFR